MRGSSTPPNDGLGCFRGISLCMSAAALFWLVAGALLIGHHNSLEALQMEAENFRAAPRTVTMASAEAR